MYAGDTEDEVRGNDHLRHLGSICCASPEVERDH